MNLEQIKDKIQTISLSHKQIVDFDYGEDFLLATGKGSDYPLAFLEIPYSINYQLDNNRFKTFSFALLILMNPAVDDLQDDHSSISEAETIADSIITTIQTEFRTMGILLDTVNGISLREFSDDSVSGVRFDITIKVFRSYCNNSYSDQFDG